MTSNSAMSGPALYIVNFIDQAKCEQTLGKSSSGSYVYRISTYITGSLPSCQVDSTIRPMFAAKTRTALFDSILNGPVHIMTLPDLM